MHGSASAILKRSVTDCQTIRLSGSPAREVAWSHFAGRTHPYTQILARMTNTRYRLFIDDLRDPVTSSWVIARTSAEAITLLETRGCPCEISFDHDLGGDDTAMAVVKRLTEMDRNAAGRFIPAAFAFSVHSVG
jgi:hypothetical protein